MMKTTKTKLSRWKIAAIAPMLVALFIFVACQEQVLTEISKNGKTLTQTSDYPPQVAADIKAYQEKSPLGKKGTITYITGEEKEIRKLSENDYAGQVIVAVYVFKNEGTMGLLLHDVGQYAEQLSKQNASGEEIFTIVEEAASPVGGMTEFFKFVGSEIKYPLYARQNNISGKVFIEFVVNEDGHLSDFAAVKGIGGGCDEEAIRVLKLAANWNPGKQRGKIVKQRMVLPITFGELKNNAGAIVIGEAQSSYPETDSELFVEISSTKNGSTTRLSGMVKDSQGRPVEGTNIVVSKSTTGTVSAPDGKFSLDVSQTSGELVFSFIGYKTTSIVF